MENAAPILNFLDGFWGTLAIVGIGLVLIFRAATEPHTGGGATVSVPTPQQNRELEQLKRKLRVSEQDRSQLRTMLSDPTAKRQHDEEMSRRRCLEVAQELFMFMRGRRYSDYAETVTAFKKRHEWKVNELRDRMDKQELLTPQERDILTFRSSDYPDKIDQMVETLRKIGMGE